MELQDLEEMDPADLADIPMDKYGNEIEDLEPVKFKDLRKSSKAQISEWITSLIHVRRQQTRATTS